MLLEQHNKIQPLTSTTGAQEGRGDRGRRKWRKWGQFEVLESAREEPGESGKAGSTRGSGGERWWWEERRDDEPKCQNHAIRNHLSRTLIGRVSAANQTSNDFNLSPSLFAFIGAYVCMVNTEPRLQWQFTGTCLANKNVVLPGRAGGMVFRHSITPDQHRAMEIPAILQLTTAATYTKPVLLCTIPCNIITRGTNPPAGFPDADPIHSGLGQKIAKPLAISLCNTIQPFNGLNGCCTNTLFFGGTKASHVHGMSDSCKVRGKPWLILNLITSIVRDANDVEWALEEARCEITILEALLHDAQLQRRREPRRTVKRRGKKNPVCGTETPWSCAGFAPDGGKLACIWEICGITLISFSGGHFSLYTQMQSIMGEGKTYMFKKSSKKYHRWQELPILKSVVIPYVHVLHHLDLDVTEGQLSPLFEGYPELPNLQSLSIHVPFLGLDTWHWQQGITNSAPLLCQLKLSADTVVQGLGTFTTCFPWGQLTSLDMLHVTMNVEVWHKILQNCTLLSIGSFTIESSPTHSTLHPVIVPNVIELNIQFRTKFPVQFFDTRILDLVFFPRVQILHITAHVEWEDPLSFKLWVQEHSRLIHTLTLQVRLTGDDLLELLQCSVNLEVLALSLFCTVQQREILAHALNQGYLQKLHTLTILWEEFNPNHGITSRAMVHHSTILDLVKTATTWASLGPVINWEFRLIAEENMVYDIRNAVLAADNTLSAISSLLPSTGNETLSGYMSCLRLQHRPC
ncbi:hypothetical protein C8R46DRAFT_1188918 [Mycena filopes]|nr:hypothetical protein C8R46DRAFT_1188918 [Mycena filopes]